MLSPWKRYKDELERANREWERQQNAARDVMRKYGKDSSQYRQADRRALEAARAAGRISRKIFR
ncbi:hypothetical protein [Actinopolymorpha alba]|uniref:hypothetical protein n=1 Tax=Actinopolymorpha alba TaxID=533267 RepID=UPI00036BA61E|nr:hypothetical protein [Actinopolymorpha alba]